MKKNESTKKLYYVFCLEIVLSIRIDFNRVLR